jgi:hypothetical protein
MGEGKKNAKKDSTIAKHVNHRHNMMVGADLLLMRARHATTSLSLSSACFALKTVVSNNYEVRFVGFLVIVFDTQDSVWSDAPGWPVLAPDHSYSQAFFQLFLVCTKTVHVFLVYLDENKKKI